MIENEWFLNEDVINRMNEEYSKLLMCENMDNPIPCFLNYYFKNLEKLKKEFNVYIKKLLATSFGMKHNDEIKKHIEKLDIENDLSIKVENLPLKALVFKLIDLQKDIISNLIEIDKYKSKSGGFKIYTEIYSYLILQNYLLELFWLAFVSIELILLGLNLFTIR